jgi:hypothetical protein
MRRALVGSDRLGSGCLVLRADTRENPGGKNGVMTDTSTYVLHSIVLIVRIRRTLRSISYSLAFRKAIGPAMAPTPTTSIRHLQKEQ